MDTTGGASEPPMKKVPQFNVGTKAAKIISASGFDKTFPGKKYSKLSYV